MRTAGDVDDEAPVSQQRRRIARSFDLLAPGSASGDALVALRILSRRDTVRSVSYRELDDLTARFAGVLADLGVEPGDRVAVLLGRGLDLNVAVVGALRRRCVVVPIPPASGPDVVRCRLAASRAAAIVTTGPLYTRKVGAHRPDLPRLRHALAAGPEGAIPPRGTLPLAPLLAHARPRTTAGPVEPSQPALLQYPTSGRADAAGVLVPHGAAVRVQATTAGVLDLRSGEPYWCTADAGGTVGVLYGVLAPLLVGATNVVDEADVDPARTWRVLRDEDVGVWYASPAVLGMLEQSGCRPDVPLPSLRVVASTGGPLPGASSRWVAATLGLHVLDTWWQAETGAITVANTDPATHPGALGHAVAGAQVAALAVEEDGRDGRGRVVEPVREVRPGEVGMLAVDRSLSSLFVGYDDAVRTLRRLRGPWYLSGDLVERCGDGWFRFVATVADPELS